METRMTTPLNGKFILITGVGHCGTKWLANVLHRPHQGIICYHEKKYNLAPSNRLHRVWVKLRGRLKKEAAWYYALRHELTNGLDSYYEAYFKFIKKQMRLYKVAGDSNSWIMARIPEVHAKLPIHCVIHLIRNGIQNVHSMFNTSRSNSVNTWLYTHYFPWYWKLLGNSPGELNSYISCEWDYWCYNWSLNLYMPKWMKDRIGPNRVLIYRLEDLLGNVEILADLIQKLNPDADLAVDELMALQEKDINRKTQTDRSPKALWSSWTNEQRQAFNRICGSTMKHYGYTTPKIP